MVWITVAGMALLQAMVNETIYGPTGPVRAYSVHVRPTTPRDESTRMFRDKRVTYRPDYSVKVRLPKKTITLQRVGGSGLLDVNTIGVDGSIQYDQDNWYARTSYIWANGKVKRISHPGHQLTNIVSYQNQRNFYYETVRQMGPKGFELSGKDIVEVINGKVNFLGAGSFLTLVPPRVVVVAARVKANGESAGMDDEPRDVLRVYRKGIPFDLPGNQFIGVTRSGAVVTASNFSQPNRVRYTYDSSSKSFIPSGDYYDRENSTIFWSVERKIVKMVHVKGVPTGFSPMGDVLGRCQVGEDVRYWLLTNGKLCPVTFKLPKDVSISLRWWVDFADVVINDKGHIQLPGLGPGERDVMITLKPKN